MYQSKKHRKFCNNIVHFVPLYWHVTFVPFNIILTASHYFISSTFCRCIQLEGPLTELNWTESTKPECLFTKGVSEEKKGDETSWVHLSTSSSACPTQELFSPQNITVCFLCSCDFCKVLCLVQCCRNVKCLFLFLNHFPLLEIKLWNVGWKWEITPQQRSDVDFIAAVDLLSV